MSDPSTDPIADMRAAATIPPDDEGCYGWPRTCEHSDDLECYLVEAKSDPEFLDAYRAAQARSAHYAAHHPWPSVATKPNLRRKGWRHGR